MAKKIAPIETKKYTGFIVNKYEVEGIDMITITDQKLLDVLQNYTVLDQLYEDEPAEIEIENYLPYLPNFRTVKGKDGITLSKFVEYLTDYSKGILTKVENLLKRDVITFHALPHVFVPGSEIYINNEDELHGGIIISADIQTGYFGNKLFIVTYDTITTNGASFFSERKNQTINGFKDVVSLKELPIQLMTSDIKEQLTERGRIYNKLGIGSHYYYMKGHMQVKQWWSWTDLRSTGRCMIDVPAYSLFKDQSYDFERRNEKLSTSLDESNFWRTAPHLYGFSFVTKQWGRFAVRDLVEIEFNDKAFDQLVLDENKKNLIKALVVDSNSGFKDIIQGKGGGSIFLLHGEPGVGKTLTAEAIAELLHRPLYSISVGELGTDTNSLEKNLRQILDMAQFWNAVILIDEADIFLEKRTTGDILRNAMVGIFLKLLEYHQGVLFLTTNRVTEFDSAFHSRISIALKYNALDAAARKTIWEHLLKAAMVTGLDPEELANIEINGRQIKNTIRLAQGLARQQGIPVNKNHINTTVEIARQFQHELKGNN